VTRLLLFWREDEVTQLMEQPGSKNLALIFSIQSKAVDQVCQNKSDVSTCFEEAYFICRFLPFLSKACQCGNDKCMIYRLLGVCWQNGYSLDGDASFFQEMNSP
jgi:hypothetical protein